MWHPLMVHSIDIDWPEQDMYYTMADGSPIYATALLLNPLNQARYIKLHGKEEWAAVTIRHACKIWEEEYKMSPALGPVQPPRE
jgi:hypothetical protein